MCIKIRRSWDPPLVLVLVLVTAGAVQAEEVPRYDIKAIWSKVPTLIPGTVADRSCIADETQARTQVAQQWSGFDVKRRRECTAETQIGGPPSYVGLLSCLSPSSIAAGEYNKTTSR